MIGWGMPSIRFLLLPLLLFNLCVASMPETQPPFSGQSMERLASLLDIPSTSGAEAPLQQFWLKHVAPLADIKMPGLRSAARTRTHRNC